MQYLCTAKGLKHYQTSEKTEIYGFLRLLFLYLPSLTMNSINIRRLILLFITTAGITKSDAHTDYLKLPLWDSMLSCGNQDTVLTNRLISKLKAINPDTLINSHIYYK